MYLIENQFNGNQKKFAEKIGYKPQVIFNIVSGRKSSPSYDLITAISSSIDDLNVDWLVNGNGEIFKNLMVEEPQEEYKITKKNDFKKYEELLLKEIEVMRELGEVHRKLDEIREQKRILE